MKNKTTCLIIVDFAALSAKQLEKVYKALKKKYPNHLIVPYDIESTLSRNFEDYDYYVCNVEKVIAQKPSVEVNYQSASKRRKLIEVQI